MPTPALIGLALVLVAAAPAWAGTAVVAAAAPLPDRRRAPWSLWWSRGPSGWRLTGAAPVLQ